MLFIANANTNNLAVVNVGDPGRQPRPLELSTPAGIHVGPGGRWQDDLRGQRQGCVSRRANRDGPNPLAPGADKTHGIGGLFEDALSIIAMPTLQQRWRYSQTVYDCSPLKDDPTPSPARDPRMGNPIPFKAGLTSLITHCVYIIKENRTYDKFSETLRRATAKKRHCACFRDIRHPQPPGVAP